MPTAEEIVIHWSHSIEGRFQPDAPADTPRVIGVIEGEGVGREVVGAALAVLDAVQAAGSSRFDVRIATCAARCQNGSDNGDLAEEAADFCESTFAAGGALFCGAVGGRFVYTLRKRFDLFCKISPLKAYAELAGACRMRPEYTRNVDILFIRENASGIYQGQWRSGLCPDAGRTAEHHFRYTEREVRRILNVAAGAARNRRGSMAVVVKDSGIPTISELWRDCAADIAERAGVELQILNVDYAAYFLIQHAQELDVVVTSNLFGDILIDLSGVLAGSRGLTYSGNFASGAPAVYQTNHGAALDLAGIDRANPAGQILSLAMMLRESFGLLAEADLVEAAIRDVWRQGWRTADLAEPDCRFAGTRAMGDMVAAAVTKLADQSRVA